MKTLLTFVLAGLTSLASLSQTTSKVNITFRGINQGTSNYQVMIDQTSYYSNVNTDNSTNFKLTITNVATGMHVLKIYKLKNNDPQYNGTGQTLTYTKNFELRSGYDMNITVLPSGQVQFTEQASALATSALSTGTQYSDYDFDQLLVSIQNKRSQFLKATTVRNAINNNVNYFSTSQIRQLLSYVTSETERLTLAKTAYHNVTDQNNFASLYSMFTSTANRNDFNNYLASMSATDSNAVGTVMTDYNFNLLIQNIKSKWSQALKADAEHDAFVNTNYYFSTPQIRQLLVLITSESDRLDLAKLAYRGVTDPGNYFRLADLFNSSTYKAEFNNYVATQSGQTAPSGVAGVAMYDTNFNTLYQNIKGKWSQALKADAVKDAFTNIANYFSTTQIRQLLSLITSESDRLELAKFSYRSVTDPVNFSSLADMFTSSLNKDAFYNYIRVQGGQVTVNETSRVAMSDYNFKTLLLSVRSNLIQLLKVSAERDIFNTPEYYFTTNQVKQLLSLINSETSRLELAKLSYKTVIDPASFTQLNDLFKVQANIDNLTNYVRTYQN